MTTLVTGMIFGAVGSLHCVGMCGPLVLTMGRGLRRPSRRAQLQHALTYHAGRVLTYVVLGSMAGLVGETLSTWGLGRALAITAGLLLLLAAFGSVVPRRLRGWGAAPAALATRACAMAGRWSRLHSVAGPALAGAANGLLPCGLVYSALLTAAAMGTDSERRGRDGRVRARDDPRARRPDDGDGIPGVRHPLAPAPADAGPARADRRDAPRPRLRPSVRGTGPCARAFRHRTSVRSAQSLSPPERRGPSLSERANERSARLRA